MPSMLFGNAFHIARVRAKRRQGEIARSAGIDASYLAAVETGKRKAPNSKTINNLLIALNMPEWKRRKFIELAVIDRMLDAAEAMRICSDSDARLEKHLHVLAGFGEKEWDNLEFVTQSIEHKRQKTTEEII